MRGQGPAFGQQMEIVPNLKNNIGIHPQALISHFEAIINHKTPKNTIKIVRQNQNKTLNFLGHHPILSGNLSQCQEPFQVSPGQKMFKPSFWCQKKRRKNAKAETNQKKQNNLHYLDFSINY